MPVMFIKHRYNSVVMLKTIEHYPGLLSTVTSPFLVQCRTVKYTGEYDITMNVMS